MRTQTRINNVFETARLPIRLNALQLNPDRFPAGSIVRRNTDDITTYTAIVER